LDETDPFAGFAGTFVWFNAGGKQLQDASVTANFDWGGDGFSDPDPLNEINDFGIGGCEASPGQTLNSWNDWANLDLIFTDTATGLFDGVRAQASALPEITQFQTITAVLDGEWFSGFEPPVDNNGNEIDQLGNGITYQFKQYTCSTLNSGIFGDPNCIDANEIFTSVAESFTCDVPGNGVDDDNDGQTDEDPACEEELMEFVSDGNFRLRFTPLFIADSESQFTGEDEMIGTFVFDSNNKYKLQVELEFLTAGAPFFGPGEGTYALTVVDEDENAVVVNRNGDDTQFSIPSDFRRDGEEIRAEPKGANDCDVDFPGSEEVTKVGTFCVFKPDPDAGNPYTTKACYVVDPMDSSSICDIEIAYQGEVEGSAGTGLETTIGSNSDIKEGVVLGEGVTIGDENVIEENAEVGDNTTTGKKVTIKKDVVIGTSVFIGDETVIEENVLVGNDTTIGKKVTIKKGAVIGNNVTIEDDVEIKEGVVIPDGTMIQAGTVVE